MYDLNTYLFSKNPVILTNITKNIISVAAPIKLSVFSSTLNVYANTS